LVKQRGKNAPTKEELHLLECNKCEAYIGPHSLYCNKDGSKMCLDCESKFGWFNCCQSKDIANAKDVAKVDLLTELKNNFKNVGVLSE
jgi:hypothetical protein